MLITQRNDFHKIIVIILITFFSTVREHCFKGMKNQLFCNHISDFFRMFKLCFFIIFCRKILYAALCAKIFWSVIIPDSFKWMSLANNRKEKLLSRIKNIVVFNIFRFQEMIISLFNFFVLKIRLNSFYFAKGNKNKQNRIFCHIINILIQNMIIVIYSLHRQIKIEGFVFWKFRIIKSTSVT